MGDSQKISSLVTGGAASAGPPLGPALGPLGVNIMEISSMKRQKMHKVYPVSVDTDTKKWYCNTDDPVMYFQTMSIHLQCHSIEHVLAAEHSKRNCKKQNVEKKPAPNKAEKAQGGQKTNLCQKDPLVKISTRSCKRPWRATKRRILETLQDDARKHGKKQSTSALSYGRSTSKKILKSVYCIIHVYDKAIPYLNAL